MQKRKGSTVRVSCPYCGEYVRQDAAGSRKDAWVECPSCGELFEAGAHKSGHRNINQLHDDDEEWSHSRQTRF